MVFLFVKWTELKSFTSLQIPYYMDFTIPRSGWKEFNSGLPFLLKDQNTLTKGVIDYNLLIFEFLPKTFC